MMLKKITNLGTSLNKTEQKAINGGGGIRECEFSADPSTDWCCHLPGGCPSGN
ncbi:hypothetical protein [Tenacibaculum discolor]|nr:hypothetical protein [Tenacibaculum discolor]